MRVIAQVKRLIKAKHCGRYPHLELLKKEDRSDYLFVGLVDQRTMKQKIKEFWKNKHITQDEAIVSSWITLPVASLNDYKKGNIIEIDISWKKVVERDLPKSQGVKQE